MAWLGCGFAWISTGFAVSVGIYYTHNANCLWAMLIPALITPFQKKGEEQ